MGSIPALDREDPVALEGRLRVARRAGDHDAEVQCLESLLPHVGVQLIAQAAVDRLDDAYRTKDPAIAASAANIARILTPIDNETGIKIVTELGLVYHPNVCYFSALRIWSKRWVAWLNSQGWEYRYFRDPVESGWRAESYTRNARSKKYPYVPKQHKAGNNWRAL